MPGQSELKTQSDKGAVVFGSNAIRLSWREAVAVGVVMVGIFALLPRVWEPIERFEPGADSRIPYELSNDYWVYGRYCRLAARRYKTLVVGDSVVWGQYVAKDQTLSHYLNQLAGDDRRFGNVGGDGSHPLALGGLVEHYGRAISGKKVVLHYNPLWMTSPKHDLQFDKEFNFNHPRLVPQFRPWIPCYTASYADRIGVVLERNLTLFGWANHLRTLYFDNKSLPSWTMENPYANPLGALRPTQRVSAFVDKGAHSEPKPWTDRGIDKSDFPWVAPSSSLQWAAFRRCISVLQARGNNLFVVIGPFNEHMLIGKSVETYDRLKREMRTWLGEKGIPHVVPSVLPSSLYADASHPISEGYALLARQLSEDNAFKNFQVR